MNPSRWPPIAHHITRDTDPRRLCDQQPAARDDIPTGDTYGLREARSQATLCPACQEQSGYPPFHLRQSRYQPGNRTLAHLYTVPLLHELDDIRNCPHCRRHPGDRTCRPWRQALTTIADLSQEARCLARGVTGLTRAGGLAATVYQFADGSVGYFAPDAPMGQEAGDLTDLDLKRAAQALDRQNPAPSPDSESPRTPAGRQVTPGRRTG